MRQRSAMVASCSLRKPLLSRLATRFTFGMHNMESPRFFACAHDILGSTADCLDPELWLVHLKCADLSLPLASLAYRSRADTVTKGNASSAEVALRRRCGVIESWRRSCTLGPKLGAQDSPSGDKCRGRVAIPFSIDSSNSRAFVERIPLWLQNRV